MTLFAFVFVIASVCVCIGYALATFFERRSRRACPDDGRPSGDEEFDSASYESEVTRELLQTLQSLTTMVDDNVQAHTSRVAEISTNFNLERATDPKIVLAAAARLMEANRQLQSDLETAKTEIRLQERQIRSYMSEARTDELTSVANRRAFEEELIRRLAQFHRQGVPLCLLLVDVDHFKRFNDYHGHQAGDAVLQSVADVMARVMRDMDLVARYGGEEFAVVLPGISLANASLAAERLRNAIADHSLAYGDAELQVTVSIGAAEALVDDGRDELLGRTDQALYAAKQAGRNCVRIHDGRRVCTPAQLVEQPECEPVA